MCCILGLLFLPGRPRPLVILMYVRYVCVRYVYSSLLFMFMFVYYCGLSHDCDVRYVYNSCLFICCYFYVCVDYIIFILFSCLSWGNTKQATRIQSQNIYIYIYIYIHIFMYVMHIYIYICSIINLLDYIRARTKGRCGPESDGCTGQQRATSRPQDIISYVMLV